MRSAALGGHRCLAAAPAQALETLAWPASPLFRLHLTWPSTYRMQQYRSTIRDILYGIRSFHATRSAAGRAGRGIPDDAWRVWAGEHAFIQAGVMLKKTA